jgi:hypothetical protein
MDRKRFSSVEVSLRGGTSQSNAQIEIKTDTPESDSVLGAASDALGEMIPAGDAVSVRLRSGGVRGHDGSITVKPLSGRPKVERILAHATLTNRTTISQK